MAKGLGALKYVGHFAEGYMRGMDQVRKRKQEDEDREAEKERRGLEMRRAQAELEKLESDKQMRERLGRLEEDVKPTQGFVVEGPDGRAIYADEKTAQTHADAAGVQPRPVFIVAGKTYDDKDSASAAAESANSPAVRLRQKAAVYASYGREDLAAAAMQNYRLLLDNNRREIQQSFLNARATGDAGAVIDAYNRQLPNGVQAELVQGQGGPMVQLTRAGKPLGQPQPFNWDLMERQVMATPDNMVEIWRSSEQLKLQGKQVDNDTRRTDATVKETDARVGLIGAQTADIPEQARDRRTQAQASATSAGAAATNAQTNQLQVTKPTVSAVPDAKGGLNFVTVPQTPGPGGTWTLGRPQVAPAGAGLQYPAGYVASQRNAGFGGLGVPGAPTVDPTAVESVLTRMEEEARRRAAARSKGPAASGSVGYE